jgi:hypothetical protein
VFPELENLWFLKSGIDRCKVVVVVQTHGPLSQESVLTTAFVWLVSGACGESSAGEIAELRAMLPVLYRTISGIEAAWNCLKLQPLHMELIFLCY